MDQQPLILPDRSGSREVRFNAVGRNGSGRHVFIVFCLRESGESLLMRPISARYMHEKEVRTYDRTRET
ncbi:BrnT family toxin [Mesorhizobium sp. CAU 1732]|uniref:BrnT family toxin n=1 Tax=Mesorhizobium sp. CAU 1732 TaxID=3140358 RepID=UPI003260536A